MQREFVGTEIAESLKPTHESKTLLAIKAPRLINRINYFKSEVAPREKMVVTVPKLNENVVLVPGSLALKFDIDLTGGHANNVLVQNVSRALVKKMTVKFGNAFLQDTAEYDLFKIYEDLFLSQEERDKRILEGIQSEDLCKIRSNAGDKKTSGVDEEKKINQFYGPKYRIRLDHDILTDHGVFYPHALYEDLEFELDLADAAQVVRGSDPAKLTYKLKNIQIEYETIHSKELADEANSVYSSGKEFTYDHVQLVNVISIIKGTSTKITVNMNSQRRSLKAILLLFTEPYIAGARDSEKYVFPDLTKVYVTINGMSSMIYRDGLVPSDFWEEVNRFLVRKENKTEHMTPKLFMAGDRFGLLVDFRSMSDHTMHGSGVRLVNSSAGVQLRLERNTSGSGTINCQVFAICDAVLNVLGNKIHSVQY